MVRTGLIVSFALIALSLTSSRAIASAGNAEPPPSSGSPVRVQLRTFPDPFTDHFTLTMPEGLRGHVQAQLLDGSYRPVKEWPLGFAVSTGNRVDISADDLPRGIYTLRIWDEYGDSGAATVQCQ